MKLLKVLLLAMSLTTVCYARGHSGGSRSGGEVGHRGGNQGYLHSNGPSHEPSVSRKYRDSYRYHGTSPGPQSPHFHSNHTTRYANGVQRDAKGRIERSSTAREQFKRMTGYPHGRPGYVIDHIIPLKRGGCDCPENMQWQTIAEAKAKDRWE